jgi:carbamoyl-phosphate synthase large subunit
MKILLTSVGRRGYIIEYFKAALAGNGEVHAANSAVTIALKIADKHVLTPLIYEENYIEFLLNYCQEHQITALVSLFDIDLLVLARAEKRFAEIGVRLILAPEDSIRICNDKWACYEFFVTHGLPTALTFNNVDAALSAVDEKRVSYPLVVKPRWGMGSLSIFYAENETELRVFYEKSQREVFRSYLKYESSITPDCSVIIQEMLKGVEHGVDVLNDLDARYVAIFPKTKAVMLAGETYVGVTVSKLPFEETMRKLSSLIGHRGILSVDCFITDRGLHLIEMNCRISGHYPLSHLAGVDFPRQLVKWLQGGPTDESLLRFKEGLTIVKDLVPRILEGGDT